MSIEKIDGGFSESLRKTREEQENEIVFFNGQNVRFGNLTKEQKYEYLKLKEKDESWNREINRLISQGRLQVNRVLSD